MKRSILLVALLILWGSTFAGNKLSADNNQLKGSVWTKEKAKQWYSEIAWPSGCNFQPSSAINQIEMWQASTFDPTTIDKELGWAEELGFTTMRVFLSSVVWQNDSVGLKTRMDQYLQISSKHNISTMFVFFDDCWNKESSYGKQPDPKPGVHNSGWVQDPSVSLRNDTVRTFPILKKYVKDIITRFKDDKRVLLWDLYNEPGNSNHGITSLPLLKNVFRWAREINPIQPLSSGLWYFGCNELNEFQVDNSDIITYHNYSDVNEHQTEINFLKMQGRPMICTEYMARRNNSRFDNIMPLLKNNNIGAINWGFVSGKTNTIYAWDEPIPSGVEPKLWFHDIFRKDHTPFDQHEINIIKNINGKDLGIKLIKNSDFRGTLDGKEVSLFTLKNNSGMTAQITNFGGRVVALWTPDRNGIFADVITGYDTFADYIAHEGYFGALIGRYANRIANGKFTLDGVNYQLPLNNGKNTLHSGPKGFHNVVWDARPFKNKKNEASLELKYLSKDGEEGFPGNLSVKVVYTLTNQNELKIEYSATTDKKTVINLTNHSFFNLSGFSDGIAKTINTEVLQINASNYTPTDAGLIPTGEILPVKGTPLDFTIPFAIGERVNESFQALIYGKGYDQNWILDKKMGELAEAAVVFEPLNGRLMRVITDQPALQFYGGNFFKGTEKGKYDEIYNYRTSFALEAQHYPDSPNHSNFPTTVLNPGERYNYICIYKFETKRLK